MWVIELYTYLEPSDAGNVRTAWGVICASERQMRVRVLFGVEYFDVEEGREHNWVEVYFIDDEGNGDGSMASVIIPGRGDPVPENLIKSAIGYLMITQNEGAVARFIDTIGRS